MKVHRRTVPKDMLAVESKGKSLSVMTHRHKIIVHVFIPYGDTKAYHEFTFDEFCALFEKLQ